MKSLHPPKPHRDLARSVLTLSSSLILCATLTGCLVAGYTSSGGWFIWPGSISLLILILLVIWLLRR